MEFQFSEYHWRSVFVGMWAEGQYAWEVDEGRRGRVLGQSRGHQSEGGAGSWPQFLGGRQRRVREPSLWSAGAVIRWEGGCTKVALSLMGALSRGRGAGGSRAAGPGRMWTPLPRLER